MGWMTGFEPATSGATVRRSTTELHPPYRAVTAHASRQTLQETLIVTYRARPILLDTAPLEGDPRRAPLLVTAG